MKTNEEMEIIILKADGYIFVQCENAIKGDKIYLQDNGHFSKKKSGYYFIALEVNRDIVKIDPDNIMMEPK